jgi:hypothetical protein
VNVLIEIARPAATAIIPTQNTNHEDGSGAAGDNG